MEDPNKVYLKPGDVVTLKQNLPNKPVMLVIRKESTFFKNDTTGSNLKGIRCQWFTSDGYEQQSVFSTKDLKLVDQ